MGGEGTLLLGLGDGEGRTLLVPPCPSWPGGLGGHRVILKGIRGQVSEQ